MPQGYYPKDPNSIDDALDELLCEYVDGTMDPDVRVVFEEYLATDPQLAAHVDRLCDTRNMLCKFGACRCASPGLQAQLRVRLAGELARKNRSSRVISQRLGNMAFLTSVVGMLLIVGMMAAPHTAIQQKTVQSSHSLSSAKVDFELDPEIMSILDDTHSSVGHTVRLESLEKASQSTFLGPVAALPVVATSGAMTPSVSRTAALNYP